MNTPNSPSNTTRLGRLLHWLDDRTGLPGALRACPVRETGGAAPWWNLWISLILCAAVLQAITGFFLWMHYSPSAQTAWESVYYLQYEVTGGWLLRGLHHWTAQVLVALLVLYVLQMIVRGTYRAPREFVFWTALCLALFALALCLTGDLLSWDQNGYASTKTRVNFLMLLPWIGEPLFRLAVGGPAFGHLALTRFFALHVGCCAALFFLFFLAHLGVARRAAMETPNRTNGKPAAAKGLARCDWSSPRVHGLACLGLLVVVLVFVFGVGVHLGAPADRDPANFYAGARPEWSFRGLYGFSNAFPGELKILPIFVFPTIFFALVVLMPVIAYYRKGNVVTLLVLGAVTAVLGALTRKRVRLDPAEPGHAFNLLVLAVLALGLLSFSAASWVHDWRNADYHAALQAGEEEAQRVKELVRGPDGIPPAGALAVLRSDPKSQGPKLWKQQCAVCHDYQDPDEKVAPTEKPTAPDLYGFPSRAWIAGLLDPQQIKSAKYLGNTRFAGGVMVRYVEGRFAKLKAEDRTAIVAALSAEARLASQAAQDEQDTKLIEKGRALIASNECARCHRFYNAGPSGSAGVAPDLTGYGSREWTLGLLADPTHASFYGLRNDRMPAYVELPAQPAKNRLQPDQIGLVTDWLRGEWYEPADDYEASAGPAEGKAVKTPVLLALGTWEARRVKQEKPPVDKPGAEALALYKREHCAVCHPHTGTPSGDIVPTDASAFDLGGFASRAWIAGLLDPKRVDGPKYFGNSAFKKGSMVGFVKGNLKELKKDVGEKDLQKLIEALAAEAQRSGPGPAAAPAAGKEAAQLFEDFTCTDCHRFYTKGSLGSAPELTGFGSREWLVGYWQEKPGKKTPDGKPEREWKPGILSDPANPRFFGKRNDGMPSYLKTPDHPATNLLSATQAEMLADWLRGPASEPKPDPKAAPK